MGPMRGFVCLTFQNIPLDEFCAAMEEKGEKTLVDLQLASRDRLITFGSGAHGKPSNQSGANGLLRLHLVVLGL